MGKVDKILEERGTQHGDFKVGSRVSQELKGVIKDFKFNHIKSEALHMILHKISRICAGDSSHKDHWDDIAGYATLVSKDLDKNE